MTSEQEASRELITKNWSLTHFEGLDRINTALKELGISPDQALQLIQATNEIKDADFRVATLDLLELRKRTGKTSKEADAYIKELDSQITSKEKQSSDWTGKIEKAKAEFKDWEQKRSGEKAAFEREQAQNKRILKEDGVKFNRELNRNKEIRENVEETIALKAELKKIGLNLATFEIIVKETALKAGVSPHIAEAIKEAVKNFGSLDKAITEREAQERAVKQSMLNLSGEEREKKETLRRLDAEIASTRQTNREIEEQFKRRLDSEIASRRQTVRQLDEQVEKRNKLLELQNERIQANNWQFEFLDLFMAMVLTSPSAAKSAEALGVRASKFPPLTALGLKIQRLAEKGWRPSTERTPAQLRAEFILIVMGDYLHSIRCRECGVAFIVNKAFDAYSSEADRTRGYREVRRSYYCPVCASPRYTKPDNTFFDLMVSPEASKKLQDMRRLQDDAAKEDPEALRKKLKLIDLVPDLLLKVLSEGHKIVWYVDDTDQRKKL
jgi:hypothetical protein